MNECKPGEDGFPLVEFIQSYCIPNADFLRIFCFSVLQGTHGQIRACYRISLICFSHTLSPTSSWNISAVTNIYSLDDSSPAAAHTGSICLNLQNYSCGNLNEKQGAANLALLPDIHESVTLWRASVTWFLLLFNVWNWNVGATEKFCHAKKKRNRRYSSLQFCNFDCLYSKNWRNVIRAISSTPRFLSIAKSSRKQLFAE